MEKYFEVEKRGNDHSCISADVIVDIIKAVIMENKHLFIDRSYLKLKNNKNIKVTNKNNKAIINLDLNYNFGIKINEVSKTLQTEITKMVSHLTGIEIEEININIIGVDI
jgi:uncharacterized alkaline shock family protein YloU